METTPPMAETLVPQWVLSESETAAWRERHQPDTTLAQRRTHDQFRRDSQRRAGSLTLREQHDTDDPMRTITGYACVTERDYEMYDYHGAYLERVAASAFSRTLGANPDVVLLANHVGLPLASTRSDTLRLSVDDIGLRYEADIDLRESDAQIVARKIARGVLRECSFGFRIVRGEWSSDHSQYTIHEVSLQRGDVSVVTYGANPYTSVALERDDHDDMDDDSERSTSSDTEQRGLTDDDQLYLARTRLTLEREMV